MEVLGWVESLTQDGIDADSTANSFLKDESCGEDQKSTPNHRVPCPFCFTKFSLEVMIKKVLING